MKMLIGIIVILVIIGLFIIISYKIMTAFINEVEIENPINGENTDITKPSRREVKTYYFAAETIMKSAYKSVVKMMDLKGNEKVMDFGSGAGPSSKLIANELKQAGGQLTCFDISETWINVVKHRFQDLNHVNYLLGDITAMDLVQNTYDVVLIHFVLHDINKEKRPAILGKLASILKIGGKLVIREPIGSRHGMPGNEIQSLMESAGLQEVYQKSRKLMLIMPISEGIYIKK